MIELSGFMGQPCRSRLAYEFVPKKDYKLNLEEVAKSLKENEVFIELDTPYLLMLKISAKNVSLFKSGKIIVKETKDKKIARKIAETLIQKLK